MDNTENVTPVGGEGATSSQDNATVSTQPVETATPVSDGQPAEAGQAPTPWDNDPRFKGKTSEDIYKAYTESEKVIGQLSQKAQLANKLSEKYGVSPEQVLSQIEQQELKEKQEYYANNPLAPVLDEVNQLKAIVQQNAQEKAMAMAQYTEENIGMFVPRFLASHCDLPVDAIEIIQERMCEEATRVFLALIPTESSAFQDLCSEALSVDGFGHFFNTYDGNSEDVEFDGETYTMFQIC